MKPDNRWDAGRLSWLADETVDLRKPSADQFGVLPLVDQLLALLERAPTPFTISLSGKWGVGKSTVAEALVRDRVADHKPACVVDAWTTEIADLRRAVAIEVGAAIRGEEHRREIADKLDKSLRVTRGRQLPAQIEFRSVRGTVDRIREHWRPFALAFGVFLAAFALAVAIHKDPWETVFTTIAATLAPLLVTAGIVTIITPSESEAPAAESVALAAAFREVVTDRSGGSSPVLVVVDNLDRLSGSEALRALGQIRSLVEIKGSRCVFLVPIDRGKLVEHLSPILGSPGTGEAAAGDYLQKFFSLEIALADPEPLDLAVLAQREAMKLFADVDSDEVASAARIVSSAADRVPRAISRLLNGLSTRYRVLLGRADITSPALTRLAFVEGLIAVASLATPSLAREPRRFVQARAEFDDATEDSDRSQALAALYDDASLLSMEWEKLRRFLVANADIPLTAGDLRLALSLREDRIWTDIDDPEPYASALEAGDAEAYAAALLSNPAQRGRAIERSIDFIEARHENGLRELVLLGIRAMSGVVDASAIRSRMHRVATANLPLVGPRFIRALGNETLDFVFGEAARLEHPIRTKLADVLADDIKSLSHEPESLSGLVRQLRELGPWITKPNEVQEALKDRPDEDHAPLFDPPPLVEFAGDQIASAYLAILENWSVEAEFHARAKVLADRLTSLVEAGWEVGDRLQQLVVRVETQLPAGTGSEESSAAFNAITKLLAVAPPSAEIDALALAAANQASGNPSLFDLALGLQLSEGAAQTASIQLMQWAANQPSESAAPVIERHRRVIMNALPDFADRLNAIWITRDDPGYARLSVDKDPANLGRLIQGVDTAPPPQRLTRAAEAVAIAGQELGHDAASGLEESVAGWIQTTPPEMFQALPELVRQMRSHRVPRARLVDALLTVAKGTQGSELDALVDLLRPIHNAFGSQQLRRLADDILGRLNSLNSGAPATLEWLVERVGLPDLAITSIALCIGRGSTSDGTLEFVASQEKRFRSKTEISEALVARAYAAVDETEARSWIQAATHWAPPGRAANSEFQDQLSALSARYPAISDLLKRLRGKRASKRRP